LDQATLDKAATWLEENGYEVYADYRDELPTEGIADLLKGNDEKFNDSISDIESNFWDYIEWDSHKDDCISALGLERGREGGRGLH
jgi:hypothetical protein